MAPVEDLTRKIGAAAGLAKANEFQAKAEELRGAAASTISRTMWEQLQMSSHTADQLVKVAGMAATVNATSDYDKQLSRMEASKRAAATRDKPLVDAINLKLGTVGIKALDLENFVELDKATKTDYIEWAGYSAFGTGPGDAFKRMVALGASQTLAEKNKPVFDFFTKALTGPAADNARKALALSQDSGAGFKKLSATDQQAAVLDELAKGWGKEITTAENKMNLLKDSNPLKLNHSDSIKMPALVDNKFQQEIARTIKANSAYKPTDEDLLTKAKADAIFKAEDIPKIAQQLSSYYRIAVTTQFAEKGAAFAGLPRPTGYGLSMNGTHQDVSGVTRGLQTWDPAAVEHWLQNEVIKTRKGNAAASFATSARPPVPF
jgi:hypothetical protein